jgi:dTDP-4-dehydrorhamnose reductase
MQRALILGSSGFLGNYVAQEFNDDAFLHSRTEQPGSKSSYVSEIDSERDVIELFKQNNFSTLINCVALADLEKCETNPDSATWLNQTLPMLLAKHSAKNERRIVHISTDAVFNSEHEFSEEDDSKNPLSQYARTKLQGEKNVMQLAKEFNILRVNFYGKSKNQKGILEFFYQNLKSNQAVPGYKDVFFTPLYVRDTARLIKLISKSRLNGIFHVVGTERLSKYEFGRKVARVMNRADELIVPVDFSQSPLAVNRTRELSLSTDKLRSLGYTIPSLESGISRAVAELEYEND